MSPMRGAALSIILGLIQVVAVFTKQLIKIERPQVSLPLARRLNFTSARDLLQHDQARARAMVRKGNATISGLDTRAVINSVTHNTVVSYTANVEIGNPPTLYILLVDTGSSNTWVGARTAYTRTSTSIATPNTVSVVYSSGSFSGREFIDQVNISTGLVISSQSIGVATEFSGFTDIDGILGLGPVGLTVDTLSPASASTIPTVTDNLFAEGIIDSHSFALFFEPATVGITGEITWGGVDNSKFTGSITFTPVTTTSPSNLFWGINQSIRYGSNTNILSTTAGVIDSGGTLLLLATNAYHAYMRATGATLDSATGLLTITTAQLENLQSLFFNIGGTTYEFTASAQLWPQALNFVLDAPASSIFLIVNDIGAPSGQGLDFINGFVFLERFYTVYDIANNRVGFATTPFTQA